MGAVRRISPAIPATESFFLGEEEIVQAPQSSRRPVSRVPSNVQPRVVPHLHTLVRDKNIVTLLCCLTDLERAWLSSFGISKRFAAILENPKPARVSKQIVRCTSVKIDKSWRGCAIDFLEKQSRPSDRRCPGEGEPILCLRSKKSR